MKDYLGIQLSDEQLQTFSVLGLAHIGDGVYELLVRTWLCANGKTTSKGLHKESVSYVKAPAQAKAVAKIMDKLSEAEQAVFKRGRNAHSGTMPKNASAADYHTATGLEALIGWLFLTGSDARLNELMQYFLATDAK